MDRRKRKGILTARLLGFRFKSYFGDEDEEKNLRVAITKGNDMAKELAYDVRGKRGGFQMKKSLDI